MQFKNVSISDIRIAKGHRETHEQVVEQISESISKIGMMTPIDVRGKILPGKFVLVAGRHRLEGAIRAGEKTVRCRIIMGRKVAASIAGSQTDAEVYILEQDWLKYRAAQNFDDRQHSDLPEKVSARKQGKQELECYFERSGNRDR